MAKTFQVFRAETDFADASGAATAVDVTTIAPQVEQNKYYEFMYKLFVTSSVTTRGFAFGLNASPTTAATKLAAFSKQPQATTEGTDSFYELAISTYDDVAAAPGDDAFTAGQMVLIEGAIQPAATQLLMPRLKPEAVAGTITVVAFLSCAIVREL